MQKSQTWFVKQKRWRKKGEFPKRKLSRLIAGTIERPARKTAAIARCAVSSANRNAAVINILPFARNQRADLFRIPAVQISLTLKICQKARAAETKKLYYAQFCQWRPAKKPLTSMRMRRFYTSRNERSNPSLITTYQRLASRKRRLTRRTLKRRNWTPLLVRRLRMGVVAVAISTLTNRVYWRWRFLM